MIWYRRDRPLETFKYQIYDVRKGQYTPAVDAWVQLLRTKYTTYDVGSVKWIWQASREKPNR